MADSNFTRHLFEEKAALAEAKPKRKFKFAAPPGYTQVSDDDEDTDNKKAASLGNEKMDGNEKKMDTTNDDDKKNDDKKNDDQKKTHSPPVSKQVSKQTKKVTKKVPKKSSRRRRRSCSRSVSRSFSRSRSRSFSRSRSSSPKHSKKRSKKHSKKKLKKKSKKYTKKEADSDVDSERSEESEESEESEDSEDTESKKKAFVRVMRDLLQKRKTLLGVTLREVQDRMEELCGEYNDVDGVKAHIKSVRNKPLEKRSIPQLAEYWLHSPMRSGEYVFCSYGIKDDVLCTSCKKSSASRGRKFNKKCTHKHCKQCCIAFQRSPDGKPCAFHHAPPFASPADAGSAH